LITVLFDTDWSPFLQNFQAKQAARKKEKKKEKRIYCASALQLSLFASVTRADLTTSSRHLPAQSTWCSCAVQAKAGRRSVHFRATRH
jgi:hypothetical protein